MDHDGVDDPFITENPPYSPSGETEPELDWPILYPLPSKSRGGDDEYPGLMNPDEDWAPLPPTPGENVAILRSNPIRRRMYLYHGQKQKTLDTASKPSAAVAGWVTERRIPEEGDYGTSDLVQVQPLTDRPKKKNYDEDDPTAAARKAYDELLATPSTTASSKRGGAMQTKMLPMISATMRPKRTLDQMDLTPPIMQPAVKSKKVVPKLKVVRVNYDVESLDPSKISHPTLAKVLAKPQPPTSLPSRGLSVRAATAIHSGETKLTEMSKGVHEEPSKAFKASAWLEYLEAYKERKERLEHMIRTEFPGDEVDEIRQWPEPQFVYLSMVQHKDPRMFNPYDLRVVPNDDKRASDYYTLSNAGLYHYIDGEGDAVYTLDRFRYERERYERLREIGIFKNYLMWKMFSVWKLTHRMSKQGEAQEVISLGLFWLSNLFRTALAEIQLCCREIEELRLCKIAVSVGEHYDLNDFHAKQLAQIESVKVRNKEIKKNIATVSRNACVLYLLELGFDEYVDSYILQEHGTDPFNEGVVGAERSETAEGQKRASLKKKMSYNRVARLRRECCNLVNFLRLVDYLLISSLSEQLLGSVRYLLSYLVVGAKSKEMKGADVPAAPPRGSVHNPRGSFKTSSLLDQVKAEESLGTVGDALEQAVDLKDLQEKMGKLAEQELEQADSQNMTSIFLVSLQYSEKAGLHFEPSMTDYQTSMVSLINTMVDTISDHSLLVHTPEFDNILKPKVPGVAELYLKPGGGPNVRDIAEGSVHFQKACFDIQRWIKKAFEWAKEYTVHHNQFVTVFRQNQRVEFDSTYNEETQLDVFCADMDLYQEQIETFATCPLELHQGVLYIDCQDFFNAISPSPQYVLDTIRSRVPVVALSNAKELQMEMQVVYDRLSDPPTNIPDFVEHTSLLNAADESILDWEERLRHVSEIYRIITQYKIDCSDEDRMAFVNLRELMHVLRGLISSMMDTLPERRGQTLKEIDQKINKAEAFMEDVREKANAPMVFSADSLPMECLEYLAETKKDVEKAYKKVNSLIDFQLALNSAAFDTSVLNEVLKDITVKVELWEAVASWDDLIAEWEKFSFTELDLDQVDSQLAKHVNTISEADVVFDNGQGNSIVDAHRKKVKVYTDIMPIVKNLRGPLKQRHWQQIEGSIGTAINPEDQACTVGSLIRLALSEFGDFIERVAIDATEEGMLEESMTQVRTDWADVDVKIASLPSSRDTYVLSDAEEILHNLDGSLLTIRRILSSPYVEPLREGVETWERNLRQIRETLEEWLTAQRLWLHLEVLFATPDAARQAPNLARMFADVDKSMKDIVRRARDNPNAIKIGTNNTIFENLQGATVQLNEILREVDDFLDFKRMSFARFFFLSNDELITLLSRAKDPQEVEPFIKKMFDGIHHLHIEGKLGEINSMSSELGETVMLSGSVMTTGGPDSWLANVEEEMMRVTQKWVSEALRSRASSDHVQEWALSHPCQAVTMASAVWWHAQMSDALARPTAALKGRLDEIREELTAQTDNNVLLVVSKDVSPVQRMKLQNIIHTEITTRDLVDKMTSEGLGDEAGMNNFVWQRHLRYSYDPDSWMVTINQMGAELKYGFEYIGATARLVVTPLTERCFLNTTQALNLCLGAANVGSPGVGKTETVRELARLCGRMALIFNCGPETDVKICARLLAGAVQSGCWVLLDEFNRTNVEVMAVVAQHVSAVRSALVDRAKKVNIDGRDILLKQGFGLFMAYNPWKPHTHRVHSSLSVLFRPVSMVAPDIGHITRIMLCGEGFSTYITQAKRIAAVYSQCADFFSKQTHYDFTLRRASVFIRAAGAALRKEVVLKGGGDPDGPMVSLKESEEDAVVSNSLRLSLTPSLSTEDKAVLESVLCDVFGSDLPQLRANKKTNAVSTGIAFDDVAEVEPKVADVDEVLEEVLWREELQDGRGFMAKCKELYDVEASRFGVLVVGEPGVGKSTCLNVVRHMKNYVCHEARHGPLDKVAHTAPRKDFIAAAPASEEPAPPSLVIQGSVGPSGTVVPNVTSSITTGAPLTVEVGEPTSGESTKATEVTQEKENTTPVYQFPTVDEFVSVVSINPASMSDQTLFGAKTPEKWEDGMVNHLIRHASSAAVSGPHTTQWVRFDGPVEPVWSENIQSVLDDSRIMCVPTGERIRLGQNMRFVIETDCLSGATPATVSRCGVVYLSPSTVTWKTIFECWLERLKWTLPDDDRYQWPFDEWTDMIGQVLDQIHMECTSGFETSDSHLLRNFIHIFDSLYSCISSTESMVHRKLCLDLIFSFSFVWGFGGHLDCANRERFNAISRDIFGVQGGGMQKNGTVYDFVPRFENLSGHTGSIFVNFKDVVPRFHYRHGAPWASISVPTIETTRMSYLLACVLGSEVPSPVILTGAPACGKDIAIQEFLEVCDNISNKIRIAKQQALLGKDGSKGIALATPANNHSPLTPSSPMSPRSPGGGAGGDASSAARDAVFEVFMGAANIGGIRFQMSPHFTPDRLWEWLEARLVKRQGHTIGPASIDRRYVVVADDLNITCQNYHESLPTIEFLRSFLVDGGYYDVKHKFFKHVEGVSLLGVCSSQVGGSRMPLPKRFVHLMRIVCMSDPTEDIIRSIYTPILEEMLLTYPQPVRQLTGAVVNASIDILGQVKENLKPNLVNPHYMWDMRNIDRVFSGVYMSSAVDVQEQRDLAKLFLHEVLRVFYDRLTDERHRKWFVESMLKSVCETHMPALFEEVTIKRDDGTEKQIPGLLTNLDPRIMMFGDFVGLDEDGDQRYSEIYSRADTRASVLHYIDEFNHSGTTNPMTLVLHDTFLYALTAMCRALRMTRKNVVLLGRSGFGRKSIVRLAAFINAYDCRELDSVVHSVGMLRDALKPLVERAGAQRETLVVVITEEQIGDMECYEDINSLMNVGEVPNLFTSDDVESILSTLNPIVRGNTSGNRHPKKDSVYEYFLNQVKENLHLILLMNSDSPNFRKIVNIFPAIGSQCYISYVDEWSRSAYIEVATHFLAEGDTGLVTNLSGEDNVEATPQPSIGGATEPDQVTPRPSDLYDKEEVNSNISQEYSVSPDAVRVVNAADAIFRTTQRALKTYSQDTGVELVMTPSSYLEMLRRFSSYYSKGKDKAAAAIKAYEDGLSRMAVVSSLVDELGRDAETLVPDSEKQAKSVDALLVKVETEKGKVDIIQGKLNDLQKKVKQQAFQTQELEESAMEDLLEATPVWDEAMRAMSEVPEDSWTELKGMSTVPNKWKEVLEAVSLLITGEQSVDKFLSDVSLSAIADYDTEQSSKDTMLRVQIYTEDAEFTPETIILAEGTPKGAIKAVSSLCQWVKAVELQYQVGQNVAPKKEKLASMEQVLAESRGELMVCETELETAQLAVSDLETELEEQLSMKEDLANMVELTTSRLNRATKIKNSLESEVPVWKKRLEDAREVLKAIIGDSLLCAAGGVFLGPLPLARRNALLGEYIRLIQLAGLYVREGLPFYLLCEERADVVHWEAHLTSADETSRQNAVLVSVSRRVPVIVDPDGFGYDFVASLERSNGVRVAKSDDPTLLKILNSSIQNGTPLVLTLAGSTVDTSLLPIILMQTYDAPRDSDGSIVPHVHIGDEDIPIDPGFKLYVVTKMNFNSVGYQLFAGTTVINWSMNAEMVSGRIMRSVIRSCDSQADEAWIKSMNSKSADLRSDLEIEESILALLAGASDEFLMDNTVSDGVHNKKLALDVVKDRLAEYHNVDERIKTAFSAFEPFCFVGALYYISIADLSGLDNLYYFPSEWFLRTYLAGLGDVYKDYHARKLEAGVALSSAAGDVIARNTDIVVSIVYRALRPRHRAPFAVKLAASIDIARGGASDEAWHYLVRGFSLEFDSLTRCQLELRQPWSFVGSDNPRRGLLIQLCCSVPTMLPLLEEIDTTECMEWYRKAILSTNMTLEEFSAIPGEHGGKLRDLERLLLMRFLQPHLLATAVDSYILKHVGAVFAATHVKRTDWQGMVEECFKSTVHHRIPVIITDDTPAEALETIQTLASRLNPKNRLVHLTMGRIREDIVASALDKAATSGDWVVLSDCHLSPDWVATLTTMWEPYRDASRSEKFRVFLLTGPCAAFTPEILADCAVFAHETPRSPADVIYSCLDAPEMSSVSGDTLMTGSGTDKSGSMAAVAAAISGGYGVSREVTKRLCYSLCLFHAVVTDRRRFGALGWTHPYEFRVSEFTMGKATITSFMDQMATAMASSPISKKLTIGSAAPAPPLPDITNIVNIVSRINYGGQVYDELDMRLLETLLGRHLCKAVMEGNGSSPMMIGGRPELLVPSSSGPDDDPRDWVDEATLGKCFQPATHGLHSSALFYAEQKEAENLISYMASMSSMSIPNAPATRLEIAAPHVEGLCDEILSSLPKPLHLIEDTTGHIERATRQVEGGTMQSDGMMALLLLREMAIYNKLLNLVRTDLTQLKGAIRGSIMMSLEMEGLCNSIMDAIPPSSWQLYPSVKPIGSWVDDLVRRIEFFRGWLCAGKAPVAFHIGSLFYPASFLATVLQQHSKRTGAPFEKVHYKYDFLPDLVEESRRKSLVKKLTKMMRRVSLSLIQPGIRISKMPRGMYKRRLSQQLVLNAFLERLTEEEDAVKLLLEADRMARQREEELAMEIIVEDRAEKSGDDDEEPSEKPEDSAEAEGGDESANTNNRSGAETLRQATMSREQALRAIQLMEDAEHGRPADESERSNDESVKDENEVQPEDSGLEGNDDDDNEEPPKPLTWHEEVNNAVVEKFGNEMEVGGVVIYGLYVQCGVWDAEHKFMREANAEEQSLRLNPFPFVHLIPADGTTEEENSSTKEDGTPKPKPGFEPKPPETPLSAKHMVTPRSGRGSMARLQFDRRETEKLAAAAAEKASQLPKPTFRCPVYQTTRRAVKYPSELVMEIEVPVGAPGSTVDLDRWILLGAALVTQTDE